MEVTLIRTPIGFIPHPDDANAVAKIKVGAVCSADIRNPRNVGLHRKWWALVRILFDVFCETAPQQEYHGQKALPSLDRFRKDVTILAGYWVPTINIRGETRLEAQSISFAGMTQEEFERLYQATINVGLEKIIPKGRYTEAELRAQVDTVMGFA